MNTIQGINSLFSRVMEALESRWFLTFNKKIKKISFVRRGEALFELSYEYKH